MERWLALLVRVSVVVLGAACGCGGNGTVDVDLVHATFDDPYRGIDRLHASVQDGAGNVIVERDFDPFGPSLELPDLAPGNDRIIRIAGYSGTTLRSRGQSAPFSFVAGSSRRVPMTFSTLPVAVALPVAAFAPGGIEIDGKLDEWAAAPVAAELHPANASYGTPKDDADLSANIYLAWNDRGLYVAMHVRDQCVVCDPNYPDKVIVSWDGRDDRETMSYGADDGNATLGTTVLELPGTVKGAATRVSDGYTIEVRIANDDLGVTALSAGSRVGFEVELFDGSNGAYQKVEAFVPSPDPLNRRPYPAEMGTVGIVQYP